jgi:hypothetical protein
MKCRLGFVGVVCAAVLLGVTTLAALPATAQSVTPTADESPANAVVWDGEETKFATGEPQLVLTSEGGGLTPVMLIGVIVVILLAGVGGWFYQRQPGDNNSSFGATTASDTTHDDHEITTTNLTGEATATTAEGDESDRELLSDEKQVLQLLDRHDGQIKRKQVMEKLGWTDAKTSKVVSGLREEGRIDSVRIGRENVLTDPDEGVTDNE